MNTEKLIDHYDEQYYNEGESEISDSEYDLLKNSTDSDKVGQEESGSYQKYEHTYPMLSLDKRYDIKKVIQFFDRNDMDLVSVKVDYKYDGIAISLEFKDNKLVRALTRGNGKVGIDVTEQFKYLFQDLSLHEDKSKNINDCIIHGELLISKGNFDSINQNMGSDFKYSHPRNMISGLIRRLDLQSHPYLRGIVHFAPYSFLPNGCDGFPKTVHKHDKIKSLFLDDGNRMLYHSKIFTGAYLLYDLEQSIKERKKNIVDGYLHNTYPCDGIVVRYQTDRSELPSLIESVMGSTDHHPKYALAYKWNRKGVETTIVSIKNQVGRTGKITPVAHLAQVTIDGSLVSKCSLHNDEYIMALDLDIGDTVEVIKSGEIIPQIVKIIEKGSGERKYHPITKCPSCNSDLIKRENEIHKFCVNGENCSFKILNKLEHFVSRNAMQINGLGPETLKRLLLHFEDEYGTIMSIQDLYSLTTNDLSPIVGLKNAKKIIFDIKVSKTRSLEFLLVGLGIPTIGVTKALRIAEYFTTMDDILIAGVSEFIEVPQIGYDNAIEIISFLNKYENRSMIYDLVDYGVNMKYNKPHTTIDFTGLRFCFTGSLPADYGGSRRKAALNVKKFGGIVQTKVNNNTDYLVVGDNPTQWKVDKAAELGINIISAIQYMRMEGNII